MEVTKKIYGSKEDSRENSPIPLHCPERERRWGEGKRNIIEEKETKEGKIEGSRREGMWRRM